MSCQGKPFALWTSAQCDLAAHFGPNNIVFKNNICASPPRAP